MGCGASSPAAPTPAAAPEKAAPAPTGALAIDYKELFSQFDTNNNGTLEIKELERALKAIGIATADFDEVRPLPLPIAAGSWAGVRAGVVHAPVLGVSPPPRLPHHPPPRSLRRSTRAAMAT